jgi:glycosyltransferase involved in cell wall biosynthesis
MLTSRFEGVPTTILESLACETPVITSNVGGVSEIIKHRENGFLFNIDKIFQETDNMLKLISNEKTLNNFGKNGRNLIKKEFSWEKVSEEIEKVYRNMLN